MFAMFATVLSVQNSAEPCTETAVSPNSRRVDNRDAAGTNGAPIRSKLSPSRAGDELELSFRKSFSQMTFSARDRRREIYRIAIDVASRRGTTCDAAG